MSANPTTPPPVMVPVREVARRFGAAPETVQARLLRARLVPDAVTTSGTRGTVPLFLESKIDDLAAALGFRVILRPAPTVV